MQNNAPVISDDAFHGLFGRITDALDPYTEGSKVGVMVSLMSAYSAYIGYGPTVETGKGSSPLALWGVLVGQSGKGRKGAATGIAMRVVEAAFASFAEESVVQGLPATGLGLITELADRAEGTLGTPILFVEEEGDALLSNARRDAKVGIYLRKAFDAQTIAHKTKMDDLRVRRPHLGLIMHVQPKNWAAVAGGKDATGGTWNRVLPVWVSQSKTLPVFESSDAHEVIRAAARALRQAGDYARQVDAVTVPRYVAQVFEAKHRPIVEAMISTETMSQYAERAMAYMIRLAGLFALSERRDEISERDFDAALALVCYSIETIAYVLPEAEASEETALSVKVEAFIRKAGATGRTATEIYRTFNLKASDLHGIVAELDTITVVKGESAKGRGGRPSVRYIYTGEPTETFDDEDFETFEADIVEDTDDAVSEETNIAKEPLALLAPTTITVNEETHTDTAEDMGEGTELVTPTDDELLEILIIDDADFWGETEEEAALAGVVVKATPEVPSAVRDLMALLEAPQTEEETTPVEPAPAMPTGVAALRALLNQDAPAVVPTAQTPAVTPVAPVPLALFQTPTSEEMAA
ncbi:DUF3987 domain-containing protein [Streptosporangium sp. CA-135522]|uniref:DUF3987 domain-containing protein n=1 Tax=Streptosporangium sp. CA-135522 TaxID=3240072 RepID=UPI003D92BE08